MNYGDIPLTFRKGCNGGEAEMSFHKSIIGNFVIYQDRTETNLLHLQLFADPEILECFIL